MTTIAASLTEMAADSACVTGGPVAEVTKLHRIGNSIFGIAGEVFACLVMIDWLKGKRDRRTLKWPEEFDRDGIFLLELSKEGLSFWNGYGVQMPIHNECYAIGSGSMSAMAALKAGADPESAVKIAAELDENTREPVEVMRLK